MTFPRLLSSRFGFYSVVELNFTKYILSECHAVSELYQILLPPNYKEYCVLYNQYQTKENMDNF